MWRAGRARRRGRGNEDRNDGVRRKKNEQERGENNEKENQDGWDRDRS